jgi:glycosyltransferase involved in cell wall biosynthesis
MTRRRPFKKTLPVTAIIPTCGRPLLLERALRSVAAQAVAPDEVIVVDDAGGIHRDVIRLALAKCGLNRARIVANSRVKGASGARNTGAESAKGELLAFLDDDDEWLPTYLSEAIARFRSTTVDMLAADLLYRYDDGSERPGKTAPDRLAPELFLTRNPGLVGSNFILRRRLYLEIGGFNEWLPASEDMDFGLRISLHGQVTYEPLRRQLVRHHQHSGARLSAPEGESMRVGVRRFFELHGHRMTAAQVNEFRRVFSESIS